MLEDFKVITFYQFINLEDVGKLAQKLKCFCTSNKIRGSVILASEGINGTLAGLSNNINEFEQYLVGLGLSNLNVKYSTIHEMPFYRLKIKMKNEIVTMLNKPIDAKKERAVPVNSGEWNHLIDQPDVIVVDVRNQYETDIGRFNKSVIPNTESFTEMKKYIDKNLKKYKDKKIAMYCTGGIRCEKASYYMKEQGFNEVFQLNGGILKYLEDTELEDTKWVGECFVFDNRVALKHDLSKGSYDLCRGCNYPISEKDRNSLKYEKDVSCPKCYDVSSDLKKIGSRERSKQISLAIENNSPSTYLPKTPENY